VAKLLFPSAPWCVESWLRRAAKLREYAHEDLRGEKYDSAAFFAQQSVELALKALLIKLTGSRPQTHATGDLLELVEKALGVVFSRGRKAVRRAFRTTLHTAPLPRLSTQRLQAVGGRRVHGEGVGTCRG